VGNTLGRIGRGQTEVNGICVAGNSETGWKSETGKASKEVLSSELETDGKDGTGESSRFSELRVAPVELLAGCSKRPSSKAAGDSKPEAYPQGYVEDFDESRTQLAGVFSFLLN
jgi:hypothetical protein